MTQRRWPLHKHPRDYDTLEWYVRRLADDYGVRYEYFCCRALGIPVKDYEARLFHNPGLDVLKRLSDGTGVSILRLKQMTPKLIWKQLREEVERSFSQNS